MEEKRSTNFIEEIIAKDLESGKHTNILTRFPPEPNGYLHLGHAASICLNFGLAQRFGGKTNLRFDDTNPTTEDTSYVESIQKDVEWVGFQWEADAKFASDYFPILFQYAIKLIESGKAYVDDSSSEEIANGKGTVNTPGVNSPFRDRSVAENLKLFHEMRDGLHPDGSKVLRAKIDMASPNMNMRDPVMYRIKRESHHRTGDGWIIYPMYDFAHGQSDSIEEVTHSICTLEFENHRPLYNWYIENLEIFPSRQIEFARVNISHMITSKRRLLRLVEEGHVGGWDDPRMSTIAGARRRGYTPAALRLFCEKVGISKRDNLIDFALLEFCVREDLNRISQRRMVVEDPIKLIITNYPEEQSESLIAENNPENAADGNREMLFSRELLIERSDFMIDPPKKFWRLGPGRTVRLKSAYIITCEDYTLSASGAVETVFCKYYPESKSGEDTSGIKAKGTLHWVDSGSAFPIELRLYDRLFTIPEPARQEDDFVNYLNPDSLKVVTAMAEKSLISATPQTPLQFLRKGYFILDGDSDSNNLIFNRTVSLKDSWAKKK